MWMKVHFNDFMLDVHKRLHQLRDHGTEAIPMLNAEICGKGWLLCFDEFQVLPLRGGTGAYRAVLLQCVLGR